LIVTQLIETPADLSAVSALWSMVACNLPLQLAAAAQASNILTVLQRPNQRASVFVYGSS
jgi:hypothetical protein